MSITERNLPSVAPRPRATAEPTGRRVLHGGKWLRETVRYAILVVASVASLYPVLWMVAVSMKTQAEYTQDPMGLPHHISFANFSAVLSNHDVLGYFLNSVIVVGEAVPIVTFTA